MAATFYAPRPGTVDARVYGVKADGATESTDPVIDRTARRQTPGARQ